MQRNVILFFSLYSTFRILQKYMTTSGWGGRGVVCISLIWKKSRNWVCGSQHRNPSIIGNIYLLHLTETLREFNCTDTCRIRKLGSWFHGQNPLQHPLLYGQTKYSYQYCISWLASIRGCIRTASLISSPLHSMWYFIAYFIWLIYTKSNVIYHRILYYTNTYYIDYTNQY